jgi:hypothetical protein
MESIHVKAKNYSNIFVESDLDDDKRQEIYLSIHITGGHCATRMTREQAINLVEALQAALAHNEQVV